MDNKKENGKNRGSTVIEMSLLIPIFLGCIYWYIMLFLFFIESGKKMEQISDYVYTPEKAQYAKSQVFSDNMQIRREGKIEIVRVEEQGKLFVFHMELRKGEHDPVENLRRWQLVTDTFQ